MRARQVTNLLILLLAPAALLVETASAGCTPDEAFIRPR